MKYINEVESFELFFVCVNINEMMGLHAMHEIHIMDMSRVSHSWT